MSSKLRRFIESSRKSEEMIHVLAVQEKNIRNAAGNNNMLKLN